MIVHASIEATRGLHEVIYPIVTTEEAIVRSTVTPAPILLDENAVCARARARGSISTGEIQRGLHFHGITCAVSSIY